MIPIDLLNKRAAAMRREPTAAERRLSWHLGNAFADKKFKQQAVIGRYIVDFLHEETKLVIECDGGQHNDSAYDKKRDKYLHRKGYIVRRFWNNDIMNNIEGCLTIIQSELK